MIRSLFVPSPEPEPPPGRWERLKRWGRGAAIRSFAVGIYIAVGIVAIRLVEIVIGRPLHLVGTLVVLIISAIATPWLCEHVFLRGWVHRSPNRGEAP